MTEITVLCVGDEFSTRAAALRSSLCREATFCDARLRGIARVRMGSRSGTRLAVGANARTSWRVARCHAASPRRMATAMLKALYCFLTGQHEYAVTCDSSAIFLQCRTCGQRSKGWAVRQPPALAPTRVEVTARLDRPVRVPQRRAA